MTSDPDASRMVYALTNIQNRYNSHFFSKLILCPERAEEESTVHIRHYDRECESVTSIKDVLHTALQRKKIQAMITLKLFAYPRFSRTPKRANSLGNKNSFFQRKQNPEQANTSRTRRSSSSAKGEDPKFSQFSQIFSRVRNLAISSLPTTPRENAKKKLGMTENDELAKKRDKFLNKLSELEADFSQLMVAEKKLNLKNEDKDKDEDKQMRRGRKGSFRERGRQIRMIDINFC